MITTGSRHGYQPTTSVDARIVAGGPATGLRLTGMESGTSVDVSNTVCDGQFAGLTN